MSVGRRSQRATSAPNRRSSKLRVILKKVPTPSIGPPKTLRRRYLGGTTPSLLAAYNEGMNSTETQPVRRKRLQFSLQLSLVVFALAAIALAWVAARLRVSRNQRAAISAIDGMGGDVTFSAASSKPPLSFELWIRKQTGDDFLDRVVAVQFHAAHAKRWTMKEIKEYGDQATAEQLSKWDPWTLANVRRLGPHLSNLPDLRALSFHRTTIPRHGLTILKDLEALRFLDLEATQITSEDLQYLSPLSHLEVLRLRRTRIRDDGLRHVGSLPRLLKLDLSSTSIGDLGLAELQSLRGLASLNLENTKITDAGMKHLVGFPELTELRLGLTRVSDASHEEMIHLKRLRTLIVGDFVTEAGIKELELALPECMIRASVFRGRDLRQ